MKHLSKLLVVALIFVGFNLTFFPMHIVGLMEDTQARQLLAMNAERSAKRFFEEAGDIPRRGKAFLEGAATQTP